ncbi:MAG: hypothetical protein U5K71_09940 [Gracilimonas sp.]|nr:hypothetical protein [Gracilimonas sp.]
MFLLFGEYGHSAGTGYCLWVGSCDTETRGAAAGGTLLYREPKWVLRLTGSGRDALRDIPPGFYRLVVSSIGYGRKTYGLQMGPGDYKNIDLSLKQVVYEMTDLDVLNDDKWRKQYEQFEELFLGFTDEADSVIILNPEVLHFDSNFWGRLTAEALAPLQIVNKALGYQIIYYLEEFAVCRGEEPGRSC